MIKIEWDEVFSYAELLSILFAALGFAAGVVYSLGGLIVDALVTIGLISAEFASTTGLGWGTLLAFGALLGMPILFGAAGWAIGFLLAFIVRLFPKKSTKESKDMHKKPEPVSAPRDTDPVANLELLEALFSQIDFIDSRIKEMSDGFPEDNKNLASDLFTSGSAENYHVVLFRKVNFFIDTADIYWELELFCDFDRQGFLIEAATGYETYIGRHSLRYCGEEDNCKKEELFSKMAECLECLFGQIDSDIEAGIESNAEFEIATERGRVESKERLEQLKKDRETL